MASSTLRYQESHNSQEEEGDDASLTTRQAYCLFISHFLSMWNSRMYEFAVVREPPMLLHGQKAD